MKNYAPLLCVFAAIYAHPSATAQSAPSACETTGTLSANDRRVIHHSGQFRRAGKPDHPVDTFSIGEKKNKKDVGMCFRYEIENRGERAIESFRWPDIDVRWIDIEPKERIKYHRDQLTNYDKPQSSVSAILAFEKARGMTKAHFTVEQVEQKKVGPKSASGSFQFYSYAESLPAVIPLLSEYKLRVVPIPAYLKPEAATKYPDVRTSLESRDIKIDVSSTASYDGKSFTVATAITIANAKATTIHAPALLAMEKASLGSINEDTVRGFLSTLREFASSPPRRQLVYSRSFAVSQQRNEKLPALFVSEHPITVKTAQGSFCIGIASYAPLAFSAGDEYCGARGAKR